MRGITNASGGVPSGSVGTSALADASVTNKKIADAAVTAGKISYGALVSIKYFQIENSEWTENSYGTYNKTVTISGIDPAKHIGILMLQRSNRIPDVNTSWGFYASMLNADNERMGCIFGCKISAVNELTLTAIEKPAGTIYLELAVMHI